MHHGEAEAILGSAGRDPKVVTADVRVVESEQLDIEPVERDRSSDVRQIDPSVDQQRVDQLRRARVARVVARRFRKYEK